MDLGLTNKIAIVTAASKGLGKATAMALAQEGVKLAICARGEETLQSTADELRAAGAPDVFSMQVDLTQKADIDKFLDGALGHYGHADILFTNSGGPPSGFFWDIDDETWEQSLQLLLMSTVRLIRGVLPGMRKNGWGRIICNTSVAVMQPMDSLVLSNATRASVHGLAKTLANNLAPEGITVNCICPGPIHTARIDELSEARAEREGISFDEALKGWGESTAMKRIGNVEEFGATAAFLASQQASFITGVALRVDGGAYRGLI